MVEDMEVREDIWMDTLTEQLKLMDMWLDDIEISDKVGYYESACLEDEDEEMEDMNKFISNIV